MNYLNLISTAKDRGHTFCNFPPRPIGSIFIYCGSTAANYYEICLPVILSIRDAGSSDIS